MSLDKHVGHHLDSKTAAQAIADEIRRAVRLGTFGQPDPAPVPATSGLTVRAFADLWEAQRGIHLAGARDNTYRLKQICTFVPPGRTHALGDLSLAVVTAGDLEALRDARCSAGKSAYTVNHDLKLLRKMFNWGIRAGYVTETPFMRHGLPTVRLLQEIPREFRFGAPEDEGRLLAACETPMLRALVLGLLDTACRPGELLSLQWGAVSLARRELVILAAKAKTRTQRMVPISTRLLAVLQMRQYAPDGRRLGPAAYVFGNEVGERVHSVREAWERTRVAAGFPGLQLRDLRHEAGSRLDEAGVPLNYVSKILGHRSLTTTTRYLNTHRRGLHAAMARLDAHQEGRWSEVAPGSDPCARPADVTQPCHTPTDGPQADVAPDPPASRH